MSAQLLLVSGTNLGATATKSEEKRVSTSIVGAMPDRCVLHRILLPAARNKSLCKGEFSGRLAAWNPIGRACLKHPQKERISKRRTGMVLISNIYRGHVNFH